MSSDQRCRGCCRAACGPDGERIAGFLKKSKSGLQAFKPQPFLNEGRKFFVALFIFIWTT
jgi:hypothetical protein